MKKEEKWTPHIIAVMAFVVFIILGLACASSPDSSASSYKIVYTEVPYSELWERVSQVNSLGQGFIVDAYFNATNAPGEGSFSIGANPIPNPTDRDRAWISGHSDRYNDYGSGYERYTASHNFEQFDSQTYKRIDKNKLYRIYICTYNVFGDGRWIPIIDKIDGLMSIEEVAAIEARQRAEREAAEEARRQERAVARQRFQENLIIGPSDFDPAGYTSIDLFRAVSNSRNIERAANRADALYKAMQSAFMLGMGGTYYLDYVSDLTFVRQNGTDITFTSDDNAITQVMSIDQRSGLSPGQRVRVYYEIMRAPLLTWDVIAIERR